MELLQISTCLILWISYLSISGAAFLLYHEANTVRRSYRQDSTALDSRQRMEAHLTNESVEEAMQLAYSNCRQHMQWEKWNCPKDSFFRDFESMNAESAFMQSITAAAIAYKVMQNCYLGKYRECKCTDTTFRYNTNFDDGSVCITCMQPQNWKNIMRKSRQTIKTFLNPDYKPGKNDIAEIRHHNQVVGLNTVKNLVKAHCNCKSWPGKCIFQSSKANTLSFDSIAAILKKRWAKAKRLDFNGARLSIHVRGRHYKNSLIHTEPSPNYCIYNTTAKIQGTNGRLCFSKNNDNEELGIMEKNCQTLCYSCGHIVRKKIMVIKKQCKCKMNGCCSVQCETCSLSTSNYYCVSRNLYI